MINIRISTVRNTTFRGHREASGYPSGDHHRKVMHIALISKSFIPYLRTSNIAYITSLCYKCTTMHTKHTVSLVFYTGLQ